MSNKGIGLDIGGFDYAAAYVTGDNEDVVTIPLFTQDIETRVAPFFCHLPPLGATETAKFYSMKQQIDRNEPLASRRQNRESTSPRDWMIEDLSKIRRFSEEYMGEEVTRAVLTVSAQYPGNCRAILESCAIRAGFTDVQFMNDAAAAAMGHLQRSPEPTTVLVYSCGYIGLEIGVLRVVKQHYREIAHEFSQRPSGRHFDMLLMDQLLDAARKSMGGLPTGNWGYNEWFPFLYLTESVKKQLTVHNSVTVALPHEISSGSPRLEYSKSDFESVIAPSVEESLELIDRLLGDAEMKPSDLDLVVLHGGTTRMEYIQRAVSEKLNLEVRLPEDDLLARGAAIYASRSFSGTAHIGSSITVPHDPPITRTEENGQTPASVKLSPPNVDSIFEYVAKLEASGQREEADKYLRQLQKRIESCLSE